MRSTRAIPRQATSAAAFVAPPPAEDDPLLAFAPYRHKAPRRNSITPEVQRVFVRELASTGIVKQAARHVGRSLEALYKLRARPGAEGFAHAWDEALKWGADRLEDCALERALNEEWHFAGWKGRGHGLLIYLIGLRNRFRVDERHVVPGHPVYERIRGEVLARSARRAENGKSGRGKAAASSSKGSGGLRPAGPPAGITASRFQARGRCAIRGLGARAPPPRLRVFA